MVYRARDQAGGFDVALKLLSKHMSAKARERLRREGELTARLRHPGIVGVHSAGEAEGRPYLAYELIEGARTLDAVSRQLALPQRVRLVTATARALGFAHAEGVIHRDVKPDNVLVGQDGQPRVADFGLARAEGLERLTRTGALVGTPLYMAPELVATERDQVGPHTDVWSLGVMLYEALTGRRPFDAETMVGLTHAICATEPTPPRAIDPAVPADLEAVCLKALAKQPADRYPNAAALADDLEAHASGQRPVSAHSAQWVRVRRRLGRVGRWLAAGVVLVAVGLALRAMLAESRVDRVAALRQALAEVGGGADVATLQSALAAGGDALPVALRREAQLVLARRLADAGERAAAAEQAVALGGGDPARVALAQALTAAGRHVEAAQAYATVEAPDDEQRLAWLELLVLEEDTYPDALSLATALAVDRPTPRVLSLQTRLLVLAGRGAEAEAVAQRLSQERPGPLATLLRAEVALAAGDDPRPYLREALERWPRAPEPWLGRAIDLLRRGEPQAAQRVLSAARATLGAGFAGELVELAAFVDALLADADAGLAAPPHWRRAANRWRLAAAERDMAYVVRLRDPRYLPVPGAPTEDARRARIERTLAGVQAQPGGIEALRVHRLRAAVWGPRDPRSGPELDAALAIRPDDPLAASLQAERLLAADRPAEALAALGDVTTERSLLLKGKILRRLERPAEAVEALQPALGPWRDHRAACSALARAFDDLGREVEAEACRERVRLLDGERRREAAALWLEVGASARWAEVSYKRMAANAERVLALDPLHYGARVAKARARFAGGDRRSGLAESMRGVARDPRQLSGLFRAVLGAVATDLMVAPHDPVPSLRRLHAELNTGPQLRSVVSARVFVEVMQAEVGNDPGQLAPASRTLDELLRLDPADTVLYALRAFCALRRGDLPEAESDLDRTDEAFPGLGRAAFYRALLLAAQSSPPAAVLAELERAASLGTHPWNEGGYGLDGYPELADYLPLPEFRRYRTQ